MVNPVAVTALLLSILFCTFMYDFIINIHFSNLTNLSYHVVCSRKSSCRKIWNFQQKIFMLSLHRHII